MVHPHGCEAIVDHVIVFHAPFSPGLEWVLAIGRTLEREEAGANHAEWRLVQVMTFDVLRQQNLDGAEVYSEFIDAEKRDAIPLDMGFHPERSVPVRRQLGTIKETAALDTAIPWFSAKLRIVRMIDGPSVDKFDDCVFVFRAADFATAFDRAIELGRARELEYLNGEQERVLWRLVEVLSLNLLATGEFGDVIDAYVETVPLRQADQVPFDTVFHPERSQPTMTGV